MAQKNATPSKAQQEILRKNKLTPATWVVAKELEAHADREAPDHRGVSGDR